METDAPSISGNYPLAGEKIGPAWRAAWSQLSQKTWADAASLAGELAAQHGLSQKTLANLLREARKAGLLEVRYAAARRAGETHKRAEYRVTS